MEKNQPSPPNAPEEVQKDEVATMASTPVTWISGWRLVAIALGTSLSLFMIQTESSITSTAIVAITNSLGGFEMSGWVFTAYLVTYSGFTVLMSRLSDMLGRKQVMLSCSLVFVIFSAACGAAQTLTQLIMFRWVKGIGASGIVSIATMYGFELRPPEQWGNYSAIISVSMAISLAIAPVIGAALTQAGQWRWCFFLNVVVGAVAILLLGMAMPGKLPQEPAARAKSAHPRQRGDARLRRLDVLGVILLLGFSALLTGALQEAAANTPFQSARVLVMLILSPVCLVGFVGWECFLDIRPQQIDPIIPWRLLKDRVFLAMLANAWFTGMIMVVTIVQIPQRLMLVNHLSAIDAGVRLLPFATLITFSSMVTSVILSRVKIAAVSALLFGALLEVAGVVGLSKSSTSPSIETSQYGFQILAGFGNGIFNILLILLVPRVVDPDLLAVANGVLIQFRILGGSLGLSIVSCATTPFLRNRLLDILDSHQTESILDRTDRIFNLPAPTQYRIGIIFGELYNLQMTILIGIAVASVIATLLQWQKKVITFKA